MKLRYVLPSVFSATILLVGCGTSTSFKSVPGPEDKKGADANASADASGQPGTAAEGSGENGNGSEGTGTTVVVGVGQTPDAPDSSVMTVSIGESDKTTGDNGEPLPSNTDLVADKNDTDAGDGTAAGNGTDTGDGTGVPDSTDNTDAGKETISDTTSTSSDNKPVTPGNSDKKDKGTSDDVVDKDKLTKNAAMECTGSSDVPVEKIKVVSSKNTGPIVVKADEYLAIHVSGNKPVVKLSTANAENAKVKGICFFVAGNHALVEVTLGINVGSFGYFGTGNMSTGKVEVGEEVTIDKISAKLRGNQASLTIKGDGKYDCGTANLGGHATKYDCGI